MRSTRLDTEILVRAECRSVGDGQSRPSLCLLRRGRIRLALAVLFAVGLDASPLRAQLFARPWLDWHTVSAGQFDVHYPTELATWAHFVAERLPAVDSAVARLVGYSPPMRVQIVIEDPFDISNGFAFTVLDHPVIVFWASPPDPRESIGQFRTWGEMLAVHEFGHMAHLTRPSRNPWLRTFWRLAPVKVGPIALRSPRWVIEGYATYIEGVITGSGRPHGVWRAATLRQWALEGRLPNYAQLSSWGDFSGGDFAYLAGSAFLEWLARRNGDSTLVQVWRRLSARTTRSFDEAFAGVYGDSPELLYDRFRAEVTADAVGIDSALSHVGRVEGDLVQHLARATGDPALSRDGRHVAIVLRSAGRPSRVVIWNSAPEPDTTEQRVRGRVLARDPEDVPARRFYPTPRRALATLVARDGRPYEDPRWFADSRRILLWRSTRRADGSLRPELYVWDLTRHDTRRLTNGLAVRDADPSPDGRSAVALRCLGGHCDVVIVDFASNRARVIGTGDVATSFARPRWSPDGHTIAVAMQRENRWRIALLDTAVGPPRFADPEDGANRFDPTWIGTSALVVVSDRSGAPNLERLDLVAVTARPLTRISGAAIAPAVSPTDSTVWFLSLHSRGYDVRRLAHLTALTDTTTPLLDTRLVPVVIAPSVSVRAFAPSPTTAEHRYAFGVRTTRWLPAASAATAGREATFALVNSDAVGRLTILGQAAFGSGDVWRGGSVDVAWRRWRPVLRLAGFNALTSNPAVESVGIPLLGWSNRVAGGRLRVDYAHAFDRADLRLAGGASLARLATEDSDRTNSSARNLAFAELSGVARQSGDGFSDFESLLAHFTAGATEDLAYQRLLTSVGLHGSARGLPTLDASASYGVVSSRAPIFEQFVIGGMPSGLIDPSLFTQRVTMGALPTGIGSGDHILTYRVATSFMGLTPYFWAASTVYGSNQFDTWHRVAGVELTIDQSSLPVLGLPGARLLAGVGHSFDEPFAHRTRGYATITLRP